MFRAHSGMTMCLWLILLSPIGCTEEPAATGTVAPPPPVTPVVTAPPPALNSIELNVGEIVKTVDCQGQLLTFGGDRPSVLMIKSYVDATQETFPSAMMQAHVTADEPASLVGQTLKAEIYLMQAGGSPAPDPTNAGGSVWHTPPGELADIKITSVENQRITGEVVGGMLINVQSGTRQPVTGKFTGPLQ
ncbi:MAG: hypothetical protein ACKVT0_19480 [Planctomycetaceae bacterium]